MKYQIGDYVSLNPNGWIWKILDNTKSDKKGPLYEIELITTQLGFKDIYSSETSCHIVVNILQKGLEKDSTLLNNS